eukprot:359504-Chlamydomonas_euryale.AAC.2
MRAGQGVDPHAVGKDPQQDGTSGVAICGMRARLTHAQLCLACPHSMNPHCSGSLLRTKKPSKRKSNTPARGTPVQAAKNRRSNASKAGTDAAQHIDEDGNTLIHLAVTEVPADCHAASSLSLLSQTHIVSLFLSPAGARSRIPALAPSHWGGEGRGGEEESLQGRCGDGRWRWRAGGTWGTGEESIGQRNLVDVTGGQGITHAHTYPLHTHAAGCVYAAIAALIRAGVNPDAANKSEVNTAMHVAAKCGSVDACRALLDGGADPTKRNGKNRTPRSQPKIPDATKDFLLVGVGTRVGRVWKMDDNHFLTPPSPRPAHPPAYFTHVRDTTAGQGGRVPEAEGGGQGRSVRKQDCRDTNAVGVWGARHVTHLLASASPGVM